MKKKPQKVVCKKCGYEWTYHGKYRNPIRCPRRLENSKICHSSQNTLNRKLFGKFELSRRNKWKQGK